MAKRKICWITITVIFFIMIFSILISTLYQSSISTSGEQDETEKKISQNSQQELASSILKNEELINSLSKEQEKVSELVTQLNEITEKYNKLEQESLIQVALLDAHYLCDYGYYKESQAKLLSIETAPLTESEVQVFDNIAKTLTKKRYPIKLR